MKHTILKFSLTLGLAIGAFFNLTGPANAVSEDYTLSYDVYAGGLHALRSTYQAERKDGSYDLTANAETNGFIGKIFPWSGEFESSGKLQNGDLIPAAHTSASSWKSKTTIKRLEFDNGTATKFMELEDGETEVKSDFEPALVRNAADLLTATLIAFQDISDMDSCNTSVPAFDGKRKFNIQFSNGQDAHIHESRYSVFSGPALRCTMTVEPLEGFRDKDMERGWFAVQNHTKERGRLPQVWFGRLHDGGDMVPVRVEISSSYGGVVAHLSDMQIPGLTDLNTTAGGAR